MPAAKIARTTAINNTITQPSSKSSPSKRLPSPPDDFTAGSGAPQLPLAPPPPNEPPPDVKSSASPDPNEMSIGDEPRLQNASVKSPPRSRAPRVRSWRAQMPR